MALCRGTLLAALRQGVAHGTLTLTAGQRQQHVEHLLNKLGRQKWTVHLRERYDSGQGGFRSLARYLGGGLLSNRLLHACDGPEVVFD
jgi:hypothetical protein